MTALEELASIYEERDRLDQATQILTEYLQIAGRLKPHSRNDFSSPSELEELRHSPGNLNLQKNISIRLRI